MLIRGVKPEFCLCRIDGNRLKDSQSPDSSSWMQAVFVGHNHGLDWCCPHKKLWLCFARHTGYGGYGSWARGARIIEVSQQPLAIKSWIRMENTDVHSEVVLSSWINLVLEVPMDSLEEKRNNCYVSLMSEPNKFSCYLVPKAHL